MSVQPLVPWLILALIASVAGMVLAAGASNGSLHLLAATVFAAVLAPAAIWVNRSYWQLQPGAGAAELQAIAARRNARLLTFAYAWGGAAMSADYSLSPLNWRHDWQYALAMIIAAVVCFIYALQVTQPDSVLARPASLRAAAVASAVQGGGALLGVAHLFQSGKIWTFGSDWAANHIFLVGGLLLAALSCFGLLSYVRLARRA